MTVIAAREAPLNPADPTPAVLTGQIVAILHENSNGFCILKIKMETGGKAVTVVGPTASPKIDDVVEVHGRWETNAKYGEQIRADVIMKKPPATIEGIRAYLTSGQIPGVGAVIAERILSAFGLATIEILDGDPRVIRNVQGIGPAKAEKISAAWAEQTAVRNILLLLGPHGVTGHRAVRIFKALGARAVPLIQADPYILCSAVHGIGFPTADAIAIKSGMSVSSPKRIAAALEFSLKSAESDGHCAMPRLRLLETTVKLIHQAVELIVPVLEQIIRAGALVVDIVETEELIYAKRNFDAELAIARKFEFFADSPPTWRNLDINRHLPTIEAATKKTLAPSQREALNIVMKSRVSIITGGPGTGKTTLLDTILRLHKILGTRIKMAAPTGRAARRIQEQTGAPASTLHRLFRIGASNDDDDRSSQNGAKAPGAMEKFDLLIVDESSMIDVHLMHAIVRSLPDHVGLLLLGDIDQLPSIGPGRILGDLIESGLIPVARLSEDFRQTSGSLILANARRINKGQHPMYPVAEVKGADSDFYFVEVATPEKGADMIVKIVNDRIPEIFGFDRNRDIQVLSPMRKGALGCLNLNEKLRGAMNKNVDKFIDRYGRRYSVGDKVMQIVNNYDKNVFNGDVGLVESINEEDKSIVVAMDEEKISYSFSDLDMLIHAYATTIHKSQGSEYPAVVIAFSSSHYHMLAKNLLYTAITRGKQFVVIVGDKRAISAAVNHTHSIRRCTGLKARLHRPTHLGEVASKIMPSEPDLFESRFLRANVA